MNDGLRVLISSSSWCARKDGAFDFIAASSVEHNTKFYERMVNLILNQMIDTD